MFTVTVHSFTENPHKILHNLKWKEANGIFFQSIDSNKKLITIKVDFDRVKGTFANNLTFKEYMVINRLLTELVIHLNGKINDSNSQLGYLLDQRPVCIVTNFKKWEKFILTAKLRSLRGQKVMVVNEKEEFVEQGLLVDYVQKEDSPILEISSCTVISIFGERKITGNNLKIEAVVE
ncbi:hypothetical protein ACOI1C_02060 [Bacillus sp. DJP31]|uniref:hypothetical protein n=1 Tax=Bacillus sp. DJP31 TaxID=3409789 RepID=UPI003BB4A1C4